MTKKGKDDDHDYQQTEKALRQHVNQSLGVVNSDFLLQSIGGLTKKLPLCLDIELDALTVVRQMVEKKVGSVLLVGKDGKIVGIFTERDYLKKFALDSKDSATIKIKDACTLNPVTVSPDTTIAYALNLMSHGGFRHLPVVDDQGIAIGVVSVRDVLDKISELLVNDMMSFTESL